MNTYNYVYRCFHCKTNYSPTDTRCPNPSCRAFEAEKVKLVTQPIKTNLPTNN